MGKWKIKYLGWFFGFIWNCIADIRYGLDCINEIGLWKENWQDFKTRIHFDTNPAMLGVTKELNDWTPTKPLSVKYANKVINNSYYTFKITPTDIDKLEPMLTEEDFKAGKAGYVWMDNKTGKIIFDENGKDN